MDNQRTFRFIVVFMVGFSIAYLLNMLLGTQRASESVQNIVSFALAPVVTVIAILGFSIWYERRRRVE